MNDELNAQVEAQIEAQGESSETLIEDDREVAHEALGIDEEDLVPDASSQVTEEQKQAFKEVKRYQQTENYEAIISEYEAKAPEILKAIQKELKNREEIKCEVSELQKLNLYVTMTEGMVAKIDRSTEGGRLLAEEFERQIQNALTHIYGDVRVGFDAPMYTKLDLIKEGRNFATTIRRRLEEAVATFDVSRPAPVQAAHPYDE